MPGLSASAVTGARAITATVPDQTQIVAARRTFKVPPSLGSVLKPRGTTYTRSPQTLCRTFVPNKLGGSSASKIRAWRMQRWSRGLHVNGPSVSDWNAGDAPVTARRTNVLLRPRRAVHKVDGPEVSGLGGQDTPAIAAASVWAPARLFGVAAARNLRATPSGGGQC